MRQIAISLVLCLCGLNANAQKCDSIFHTNDSSFCMKTVKENNVSNVFLSKKKSSKKGKDNEGIMKYVNMNDRRKDAERGGKNNKLPEYRIDGNNKNDNFWAEFFSKIIFR